MISLTTNKNYHFEFDYLLNRKLFLNDEYYPSDKRLNRDKEQYIRKRYGIVNIVCNLFIPEKRTHEQEIEYIHMNHNIARTIFNTARKIINCKDHNLTYYKLAKYLSFHTYFYGSLVDLPISVVSLTLKNQYQYFTEADLAKLRKTGCNYECRSLEDAVKEYIGYLESGSCL